MKLQITETFAPTSHKQWRDWLSQNHHTKKEIWLIFYKKSTGQQTISLPEAIDEALCFGWIDSFEKGLDNQRFALRFTPRSESSNWSVLNAARYKALTKEGRMTVAGKTAFMKKKSVYIPIKMTQDAREWHLSHRMPKNPTLAERIEWHKGHIKHCGCRPIPESIKKSIKVKD